MKKTLASQITKYQWKDSSSGLLEVMTEQEKNCVVCPLFTVEIKCLVMVKV
jgi:hypothetical protein